MQASDLLKAVALRSRLAMLDIPITVEQAETTLALLLSHGWKLTNRSATPEMVDWAADAHSDELRWAKMWEHA